ncbi:membrane associated rhomboid family serine protease [Caulobacter sp. BE264]|uniref:rhomboid family intramembrane serine protease n=1 Tax=Caulobacter sp. BE264 TaxID=2817724 RepID=UPI00285F527E|nr:rhomboid family intramembrane serine protease [Caulobacter sp. BE264]MDR7232467.1 membrane associated rhomboid family serine protease [Caulobacter sp. BE264]
MDQPPRPEPIFNAPWPALLVAAAVIVPHLLLQNASQDLIYSLALVPREFWEGRWTGVITMQFVHGGWIHAIMNAVFGLAFGAPVSRVLGLNGRGGGIFCLFYLACGVVAGVGFAAIHPQGLSPVVGASGAIAGLMGAAARTMDSAPGQLGPVFGPRVISLGLGWLVVNLVLAVTGSLLTMGAGGVAWEAHLIGFAAGVLLIGPFARWAGPPANVPDTH